jgi:hypothetical protein
MQKVYIVVDPNFGERLREIKNAPVWITMSPINEPVIRSLWATNPQPDHLIGITGFSFEEGVEPENLFLNQIDMIDLHHGPYSSKAPYTILDVIGTRLTEVIRGALYDFGFTDFVENSEGFVARRTLDEAKKLRE